MQVALLLGADVIPQVLDLVLSEISSFANSYSGAFLYLLYRISLSDLQS